VRISRQLIVASLLAGLISLSFADSTTILNKPINMKEFQQCHEKLNQCAMGTPMPTLACVKKAMPKIKACKQTAALAKALRVNPAMLDLKSVKKYSVIKVNYIADGQQQYYLLTPKGKLIDPVADVKTLKQYKGKQVLVAGAGAPTSTSTTKGMSFSFPVVLKEGCMACRTIAKLNSIVTFDVNGKAISSTIQKLK
jgi:hypothetical protein